MNLIQGQRKLYETQYGKEEALCFNVENNKYWVKRYLNNRRYEIGGLLAIGGFGCVFGAYDLWNYKNQVVIKTPFYMGDYCRPYIARSKQVFEKQLKALNKIYEWEKKYLCNFSNEGFDNIVNINDFFKDRSLELCMPFKDAAGVGYYVDESLREKAPFIVMKYIPGKELKDLINKKPLNQIQTLQLAKQLLVLLSHLHKQRKTKKGIPFYYLLCDLKADNIIVCDDEIILIDFGATKIYRMDQQEIDIPISVTDGYAAPEVYSGSIEFCDNPKIDKRFDVFTVGALMVHCLTGKHPRKFLVSQTPPEHDFNLKNYPDIIRPIKKIIMRATHKDRQKRYPNSKTMLKAIWKTLKFCWSKNIT